METRESAKLLSRGFDSRSGLSQTRVRISHRSALMCTSRFAHDSRSGLQDLTFEYFME